MSFSDIPPELKERRQWVCWSLVHRDGKPTKLPINAQNGSMASSTDPSTWCSFYEAVSASTNYNGIGFVFSSDDGFFGLDLDNGIDSELVEWMATYAEKSQSGRGCHIIGRGKIPGGIGKRQNGYELYDRGRYFVMTGDVIRPFPIADCQDKLEQFIATVFPPKKGIDLSRFMPEQRGNHNYDVIDRIRASAQADKFDRLWRGDMSEHDNDHSIADAALLSILRFWTGGNKELSLSLFGQSALAQRSKWWNRKDYQERTWRAIDNGEVYMPDEPVPVAISISHKASPWRKVSIDHVAEAIKGTILEPMSASICSACDPPLPLEVGLAKSLVLCGAALTTKLEKPRTLGGYIARGNEWARLKINTADGQVCNFWILLVAESGSGKDIGKIMERVAVSRKWLVGSAGSEEGIADAYIQTPNGILCISEMLNWLDVRHWQSRATSFLTGAFNAGWFSHAMSGRSGNSKPRETDFCYPNIYASVQPGIIQDYASKMAVDSGFLGRFLVAKMPDDFIAYPTTAGVDAAVQECIRLCDILTAKEGIVTVPSKYSQPMLEMFSDAGAELRPTWRRLCNEYYPRLAVLCSITPDDVQGSGVIVSPDAFQGAGVLIQWFYWQAEQVLGNLHYNADISRFESLCERVLATVKRLGGKEGRITKHRLSQAIGRGTKVKERDEAIRELESRGRLVSANIAGVTHLAIIGE